MSSTGHSHALHGVLEQLSIPEATELFAPHWEDSVAALPDDVPHFLRPDSIREYAAWAHLPDNTHEALFLAAERTAASLPLLQFAWHCQRLLGEHFDYETAKIRQWPTLERALDDLSGAFYLLVGLAAIPRMRAAHARHGIPSDVSRATCGRHYPETLGRYREHHDGRVGVLPGALYWLRNYVLGDLYRIGRLEYMIRPFPAYVHVYRHRSTRAVVALATEGSHFDGEGLATAADAPGARRAAFWEAGRAVHGTAIAPDGYATAHTLALPLDDWQCVLAPGDPVLDVHIPTGGQMTLARCRESMQQAMAFFAHHFPQQPFSAFSCGSWILNPQLAQIYRPDSNMVLWQRELYLYPIPSGDRSGLVFVFGKDDIDLETAPRNTSLRRTLLDHMRAGGRLIGGGMFFLCEDFDQFGMQAYRRCWNDGATPLDRGSQRIGTD